MVGRSILHLSAWIVGLVIVASAASHANAISCPQAIVTLLPCKDYLELPAAKLTAPCCQAASSLNNMVHSKPDLRFLCGCLKLAASSLRVIIDRAKSLPQDCHIQVPVPIDPNVDCNSI